jgi:hypothetical protein
MGLHLERLVAEEVFRYCLSKLVQQAEKPVQ